jgi:hypothetical protein
MLSCKDVATRASALIDGELGAWTALQIRLHLAMCKGCDRFISQMRITRDLAAAAEQAELEALQYADDGRFNTLLSVLREGKQSGGDPVREGPQK